RLRAGHLRQLPLKGLLLLQLLRGRRCSLLDLLDGRRALRVPSPHATEGTPPGRKPIAVSCRVRRTRLRKEPPMDIRNVGVIGAGTMGNGIAQVFAMNVRSVALVDVEQGYLDRAMANMVKSVRKMAEKAGKDLAAAESELKGKVR